MATGGYQIIDLENRNFKRDVTQYYKGGIYEIIEATRSPILITNFVFEGVELRDRFIEIYNSGVQFHAIYEMELGSVAGRYSFVFGHDTDGSTTITFGEE